MSTASEEHKNDNEKMGFSKVFFLLIKKEKTTYISEGNKKASHIHEIGRITSL